MTEAAEALEVGLDRQDLDAINIAVGCGHYVQNHRTQAYIDFGGYRSPRLTVSRYYWDLEPPLAVDFVRDLKHKDKELEVGTKRQHFTEQDIRYILLRDAFDGEGAEAALARLETGAKKPESDPVDYKKPVTGPRRKRT